ncbi:hypothetical protein Micbo1qcDRAFT_191323 [Microdochium bolleyi]|uniref:Uncharacterized protein n=1 Tax=Microdochium bolleyi TaxID=196109 RepID=A0A136JHI6_9PEZI|nr:hypothetical protein Micbo1qcDRAFT_191323 [Microdochium bolleyi]
MRRWALAALALVLNSGVLPTTQLSLDSLSHKAGYQSAVETIHSGNAIDVAGGAGVLPGHGNPNKNSTRGTQRHGSDDVEFKNSAISIQVTQHNPRSARQVVVTPDDKQKPTPPDHELDLDSAEALIRTAKLDTIARRPRRPPTNDPKAPGARAADGGRLDGPVHERFPASAAGSETSSARPLTQSPVSGRRRLAEMAACLGLVFFVFTFWL